MKKFVVIFSFVIIIVITQMFMFNNIYFSKEDKQLAQIIENAVNLISNDLVKDYDSEFTIPNVKYVCFAGSIYSDSVHEITRKIYPEYKYSNYLEARKHFRKGEGSSILMFVKEDSLIPIFIANYFFDIKFSENLKEIYKSGVCYESTNHNITVNIKKQNGERVVWWNKPVDKAFITIK